MSEYLKWIGDKALPDLALHFGFNYWFIEHKSIFLVICISCVKFSLSESLKPTEPESLLALTLHFGFSFGYRERKKMKALPARF